MKRFIFLKGREFNRPVSMGMKCMLTHTECFVYIELYNSAVEKSLAELSTKRIIHIWAINFVFR